jgi:hypothetical protein
MKRVILESPYRGEVEANLAYARRCVLDCLQRGESPIVSHLLFTQMLDDSIADQRKLGIDAGMAWIHVADAMVLYIDRGISEGMREAMKFAQRSGVPCELRLIEVTEMGAA